jgi:murein DD-endopeptidase MepM/ murein hydrolase activator NlpD
MPPRPQPQPGKTYRGRRRLPKIPVRRLAKVMSTAFVGAIVVALAAGAVMPHLASRLGTQQGTSVLSLTDKYDTADKAARADEYGPAVSVDPNAQDLWLLPLRFKYYVSSPYGLREGGEFHYGNDLAAPTGTPTYAVHAGKILIAGFYGGYGLCTMIDVGNGVTIVYGHSSLLLTTVGQQVQAGQKIAEVGSTGESTGPHLHFEIRVNGNETDPTIFMGQRGVDIPHRKDQISQDGI